MIVLVFNNSTDEIIEDRVNEKLDDIALNVTRIIDRNKLVLESFASNPFVINGLLDREHYLTTTVNYLNNARFIDKKYMMNLLNFKGDVLIMVGELIPLSSIQKINKVLDGSKENLIDSVIISGKSYIRIYTPIKNHESIQGILMVAIPMDRYFFLRNAGTIYNNSDLLYVKDENGKLLVAIGDNSDEFIKNIKDNKDLELSRKIENTDLEIFYTTIPEDIIDLRNKIISGLFVSSIIVLIIVASINLILGNRYFIDPLLKLQKKAINLAKLDRYDTSNIDMFVAEIHSLDKILANVSSEIVNYESELVDNIKELKKAQNQIIEAEKLAALGNLVSGIAHEVNTPLGVSVTANSYIADNTKKINERLLNRELTKTDFEKYLNLVFDSSDMVSSNLERAAKLISDFKSISVTQTNYVVEEFNFNNFLYKITNVLRSIYKKRFQKLLLSVMKILK